MTNSYYILPSLNLDAILIFLQNLNPVWISFFIFIFSIVALLTFFRFFGESGLLTYIALSALIANIQALKAVQFPFFPEPIALGTVVFTSIFLCSDVLNEFYGADSAKKGVQLSFCGYLMATIILLLTAGYKPLPSSDLLMSTAHTHIQALFTPAPAIFCASLIAYYTSQYIDIFCFRFLHKKTNGELLWLRTIVSTVIAVIWDNTLFAILAWFVFAPNPYDITTIWYTYIVSIGIFRIILSILYAPFIYLARFIYKKT